MIVKIICGVIRNISLELVRFFSPRKVRERQLRRLLGDGCVCLPTRVLPLLSPINKVTAGEVLMTSWWEGLCLCVCVGNKQNVIQCV